jgi:dihydroxyacetone kinase-like protein
MHKLINHPSNAVVESLEGFALAYADFLRVQYSPNIVYRADAPVSGKVAVISGSGSGHEPLNIGYVGPGMLDAACPGKIFTSPTPDQYLAATHAVHSGAGVLYVIKNYMGGVLNTEMAMEMIAEEGIAVASVLINDDVAVDKSSNRRGMGAAVIVEKIAGAAAERGQPLAQVAALAQRVNDQARSMGVALTSCTSPTIGHPTFQMPEGQIEIGVGIHGEAGRRRAPLARADEVVDMLALPIMYDLHLGAGDRVLALVSGLGGTPQHELFIVYRHLHHLLAKHSIQVERRLIGNYITSLDMAGCLVTLVRLDAQLLELWDAPVRTPALVW